MQESEVGIVGESGDADDGQRAGFGSHNRERNRRPWNVLVGQEIIAQRALLFTKAQPKESDARQIGGDDGQVKRPEFESVQVRSPVLSRIAFSTQTLNNLEANKTCIDAGNCLRYFQLNLFTIKIFFMMHRVLMIVGTVFFVALLGGGVFMIYKFRHVRQFYHSLKMPAMPDGVKTARVVSGGDRFSKEVFYREPDLGLITDIRQNKNHEVVIVGQHGAAFLTEDRTLSKKVRFDFEGCSSEVIPVELGSGSFLCRGSWNTDVTLLDSGGKTLWSYGGSSPGIDDATAGELGKDGLKGVVVGLNGGGGVRLLSSDGKELWKQEDGNVWHVEIVAGDEKSGNVVLHSNAGGELTVRDANGNIVGRYVPDIYLANFSLSGWRDDLHLNKLVAVDEDFVYVMSMQGRTITHLRVPGNAGIAEPKGTPVHFSKNTPYYASLLRHYEWSRSLLYIYDEENQLVYDEVLDHDCDALHAVPEKNGTEYLLLGCDGSVWKYSQAKK